MDFPGVRTSANNYTPPWPPLWPLRLGNDGVYLPLTNERLSTFRAFGRVRIIIRPLRFRFRRFVLEVAAFISRLAMEDAVRPWHPDECE